jgi:hypothetical protein
LTESNAARSQAVLLSSDPVVEVGLKSAIAARSAQIGEIQKLIDASGLNDADRAQMQTMYLPTTLLDSLRVRPISL